MSDLNGMVTREDVVLINAVCSGMPLDFTTQFMTRIPQLRQAVADIGWVHKGVPEVAPGQARSFNAVVIGEDGEQRVLACVCYLNSYELNVKDTQDRIKWADSIDVVEDKWGDCTTFYTGWAFSENDSYEEIPTWDFIQTDCLVAWRELPKYNGFKYR